MRFLRIHYTGRAFFGDLFGALIAALIALPYGLAMAGLMGLPPALGLVTSVATAPITAILGRNPVLIGGTASATVPFIAHAVSLQGIGGAAKVCMVASVFMLLFCFLRLGQYLQKVPHAVVTGFSCGIGAMMVLSQIGSMLGVSVAIDRSSNNLLYQTWQVLMVAGNSRPGTVVVASVVILTAFVASRFSHKLPAPLLGVTAAILVARLAGFHERVVGTIDAQLPALVGFSWSPGDVWTVLPAGLGLAFVSSINILLTSRVVEHFRGRHRPLKRADADRELGAYGVANMAAAMFGAPMSVGIPARSLASVRCGATTRISNLAHAAVIVALVVLCGSAIAQVPLAALAAVTAWVGVNLLEWSTWKRLTRMRRLDAAAFLVTAIAVLIVNAIIAVALGCSLYMGRWLWSKVHSINNPDFARDEAMQQG